MPPPVQRKSCDRCKFWKLGDPLKEYGNYGVCAWALRSRPVGGGPPYGGKPFWMAHVTHRTVSWEGEQCSTFVKKRGAKP